MEEEVKKKKNKINSSSNVRKKNVELSSDELLDQIMNKKKSKSTTVKRTTKTTKSVDKKAPSKSKSEKKKLSDEELLDNILTKKKAKKTQNKNTRKKKTSTTVDKEKSKQKAEDKQTVDNPSQKSLNKTNKIEKEDNSLKEDLIITREISFDYDKLDLNNKKVLAELKNAIENFDNLEDLEEINSSLDLINEDDTYGSNNNVPDSVFVKRSDKYDDDYLLGTFVNSSDKKKHKDKIKYDNNEGQRFWLLIICLILFSILIYIFYNFIFKESYSVKIDNNNVDILSPEIDSNHSLDEQLKKYTDCISAIVSQDEYDLFLDEYNALNDYVRTNYRASVAFENLVTGYSFTILPNTIFYAASTIKVLDGLYIYQKAFNGEIDLDSTLVYTSNYKWSDSKGMSLYNFGDKVTLRDLVRYSISFSDNSAHQMLVDYIGRNNLKEFGESLGATNTLNGLDNFGNISTKDAIIYMKAVNDFVNNSGELGEELNDYLINADQNDLAIEDLGIAASHKYGSYSSYYHDYGIVYAESPYVVVILTTEGNSGAEDVVREKIRDIGHRVYEFNQLITDNRKQKCSNEVYGI